MTLPSRKHSLQVSRSCGLIMTIELLDFFLNHSILQLLLLVSHLVVPAFLRPHGQQHARLPCPSPSPGVCPNSCPLNRSIQNGVYKCVKQRTPPKAVHRHSRQSGETEGRGRFVRGGAEQTIHSSWNGHCEAGAGAQRPSGFWIPSSSVNVEQRQGALSRTVTWSALS